MFVEADASVIDFNDPTQFRTPLGTPNLVIAPNVLAPGVLYRFRLIVTDLALRRAEVQPDAGSAQGDRT